MRKIAAYLMIIVAVLAQSAISQEITLRFTGATSQGFYVQLDSVKVQNVSRSWSETVVYPDTVITFTNVGIADVQSFGAELTAYPNPFNGTTNIAVTLPQSGNAVLKLFNLAGQKVAERSFDLQAGSSIFEVTLQNPQVYLLAVTTPQGRSTIKLLNRKSGEENEISLRGNVVDKRQSTQPFQSGDELKIVGYASANDSAVASQEVLQTQTASQNFTLLFSASALGFPTVTTNEVINVTGTTADCGGNVTADCGNAVTARGVCWSTSTNPTISGNHTTNGSGRGSFATTLTGLSLGTTYYIRAYATNSAGTAYGIRRRFTTLTVTFPSVNTYAASNVTGSSAVCSGIVTADGGTGVTLRGVCWSTSQNPTINDNRTTNGYGTGSFTDTITGLTPDTTYYVRAYATNSVGTSYGNEITFTTTNALNDGLLTGVFSVGANRHVRFSTGNLQWRNTGTHAVAGGGTGTGTWRFAIHQYDKIGNNNRNVSSSSYSGWIDLFGWGTSGYHNSNDQYNTQYQPNSFFNSSVNTTYNYFGYGPSINMTDPNLTGTSANYDWGVYNAISNGGCRPGMWRTLSRQEWDTLLNYRTTSSGVRFAYATVNGAQGLIIVPDNWSTSIYALSGTNTASAYTSNVITSSQWAALENAGCVFLPAAGSRGGSSVYDVGYSGIYWTSTHLDSACAYGVSGCVYGMAFDGGGSYLPSIDGYYRYWGKSVRLVRDTVTPVIPTITTDSVSAITDTTAICGGIITADGGRTVTARGVCWSTSQNPTISGSHTTDSSGTGSFTSSITGLTSGTTYYVRAYATNSVGTAYGNEMSFTTALP